MMHPLGRLAIMRLIFILGLIAWGLASGAPAVEPIKVGVTVGQSSRYTALDTERFRGMQMWVDDVNERGALLGRPVELVVYDDRSDRQTARRLYEKLITEDQVDFLFSPYSSGLTLAVLDLTERHRMPMVTTASSPRIWSQGYQYVFGIDTPADQHMDSVLALAAEKGLKRVALAYASTAFPQDVAQGVRIRAHEYGMARVFDEEFFKDTTNFSDLVERMVKTHPDVVIIGSYLNDAVALMRQAKTKGLAPKLFAFSGGPSLREFGDRIGPDAEGVISSVQWAPGVRMPGSFDFSFRFKQKYGHHASYPAAEGYAAGQILEAAVRLAGSTDKDAVRAQLATLKFRSLLGHYRVDETGKQTDKPMYVIQWQKGRRQLIYPKNLARADVIYPFPSWPRKPALQ